MNMDSAGARMWLRDELGIQADALARLEHFVDMLLRENETQNLVARGTLANVWTRHIVDSAQLLRVPRETIPGGRWLDLGAGAGFPGLIVAMLQPDRPVTLVDSRRLRTEWLERASAALGLDNVSVALTRVEDLAIDPVSVISARAFAPLDKLLALSARFSSPETLWLLPKGASAQHELQMLPKTWHHMFHVEQSVTDPAAGIIAGRLLGSAMAHTGKVHKKGNRR